VTVAVATASERGDVFQWSIESDVTVFARGEAVQWTAYAAILLPDESLERHSQGLRNPLTRG